MRRSKRAHAHQPARGSSTPATLWIFVVSSASSKRQRRQNRGHALAPAWSCPTRGADHQDVVPAGAGNFQCALGRLLPAHILEIHGKVARFIQQPLAYPLCSRRNPVAGIDEMNHIEQRLDRIHVHACDHRRFARIHFGHDRHVSFSGLAASMAIGKAPRTPRTPPSSDSSPTNSAVRNLFLIQPAIGPKIPSAIGKSKPEPSLRISAGARLIVMWVGGIS